MPVPILGLAITSAAIGGIARLVIRYAFVYLGVGIVSLSAGTIFLNQLRNIIVGIFGELDGSLASILGILRIDECVSIIFLFLTLRLTIAGFKKIKFL